MKRYVSLLAGFFVQIALGGIYAFSSYVPSFQNQWGFNSTQTQAVFGLTIFLFTLIMIYTGRLLVRKGPRFLIVTAGLLFMAGHIIASSSHGSYPVFLLSYLLFISPALAFGYVCPISAGLLWFPGHKGLVTGLSVAGYGMGGVILSTVVEALLEGGRPIEFILKLVGIIWGSVILLSGLLSSTPPGMIQDGERTQRPSLIREHKREFTGITLYLFFGTLPGLMLIGALKPFGLFNGVTAVTAAVGVAVLSAGNGLGRLSWGILADRFNPRKLVMFNMTAILLSVVLLMAVQGSPLLYVPAGFLLGFCYGGPVVITPDQIGRIFGASQLSRVYPSSLAFHGFAAALGASAAGYIFYGTGSYFPVLLIAALGTLIGLSGYYWLLKDCPELN